MADCTSFAIQFGQQKIEYLNLCIEMFDHTFVQYEDNHRHCCFLRLEDIWEQNEQANIHRIHSMPKHLKLNSYFIQFVMKCFLLV